MRHDGGMMTWRGLPGLFVVALLITLTCQQGDDESPDVPLDATDDGPGDVLPDAADEASPDVPPEETDEGTPDVPPDTTDEDIAPDGGLDVPGPDATCAELGEFIRSYGAAHSSCTSDEECEVAVAGANIWDCRFCYLTGVGSNVAVWRSDAVTPEVNAARRRYEAECRWSMPNPPWQCMFDTRGRIDISCRTGQCFGVARPTGCPTADGGGGG